MVPILNYIISFISVPITTRLIQPEEMGKINFVISNSQTVLLFILIGLDQAFFRFYYEQKNSKDKRMLFTSCIAVPIFAIAAIAIVLLPFSKDIAFFLIGIRDEVYYLSFITIIIFNIISRYLTMSYRLEEKPLIYLVHSVFITLLTKTMLIITGVMNPTAEFYLNIIIIQNVLVAAILLILNHRKLYLKGSRKYFTENKNQLFSYALPLLPDTMITSLNTYLVNMFIAFKLSYAQLGIYSAATAIVGTISVIQLSINLILGPYILKNYKNENHHFWLIHKVVAIILSLMSIGVVIIQPIFLMLLGEEYREASKIFALLLCTPIFYTLTETTYMGFAIMKKNNKRVISSAIALVMNLIMLSILYFVPDIDILYVTVVTAINAFILMMAKTILAQKLFKTLENYNYIFLTAGVIIACALINVNVEGIARYVYLLLCATVVLLISRRDIKSIYQIFVKGE